jgi:hypothetical protein
MIALEIELNGKSLGTAGTSDLSVLNAIVNAVGKLGAESRGARNNEESFYLELTVGGLTGREPPGKDEHLTWVRELLNIGDTVSVRVVEAAEAAPPASAKAAKSESDEARYFKWAKDFYLAHREKYEAA